MVFADQPKLLTGKMLLALIVSLAGGPSRTDLQSTLDLRFANSHFSLGLSDRS
jgi:hypothetical protein